jgi:predicted amidophosphoribosyltransferase
MTGLCLKCGAQLSSPWRFCPLCGIEVPQQTTQPPAEAKSEITPMRSVFTGLFFGLIVTPMCLIVGAMLCLTGLGAILGIPMIIGGIAAPILGPMICLGEPKGACPWCGTKVSNVFNASSFECHECGKRIDAHNRQFIRAA